VSKREIFQLKSVPVYQNKMFDSQEDAKTCTSGDVVLVQDLGTGLVFNDAYNKDILSYDESYQNEQGHSPIFQSHLNEVLGKIDLHFSGKRVLEVGCGKGSFLDQIRQRGHDAIGVDPAYEGDAPYIHKQHFDASLKINADAVVLRHVLEHIPQPLEFLRAIASANGGQGKIYIEVPCLDWIIRKRAWFDVFYEHVNYFRLSDFNRMFGAVHEMGHLFGGQYIYVVAELDSLRKPDFDELVDAVHFPKDFLSNLENCLNISLKPNSRIVWGAAAKGVMFSHHMTKRGAPLDFAIDINPAKQGKFLAGSALPVLSPADGLTRLWAGGDVFVMNSNYMAEISDLGGNHLNYISVDRR
jgi:SAM-dependent methyltransferase